MTLHHLMKEPVMLPLTRALTRTLDRLRDDRGDVPGWVLITLMTAGLVLVIWAVAGPALSGVFEQAISSVAIGVTP